MSRSLPAAAVVSLCLGLTVAARATQDPLAVSPDAYRLEFENDWVKVVRVVYGPHVVIAPHFHTERASAYVYLNDGGPILFRHENLPYSVVTRPATRAGSFRVYKGLAEVHSVENPTAIRNEFLRVEFKTEPLEDALLKGKFFRDETGPTASARRTQFENAQVRITRVLMAGEAMELTASHDQPALLVALVPTGIEPSGGSTRPIDVGGTAWLDGGTGVRLHPIGTAGEVLRFDFKSRPRPLSDPAREAAVPPDVLSRNLADIWRGG
ncbi:MAG: hypothetical protein AB7O28_18025 [Vicinamibacterales bacterium]